MLYHDLTRWSGGVGILVTTALVIGVHEGHYPLLCACLVGWGLFTALHTPPMVRYTYTSDLEDYIAQGQTMLPILAGQKYMHNRKPFLLILYGMESVLKSLSIDSSYYKVKRSSFFPAMKLMNRTSYLLLSFLWFAGVCSTHESGNFCWTCDCIDHVLFPWG